VELMPPAPGVPEHPRLLAIARDLERNGRRVDELTTLVYKLAGDITRHLDSGSPGSGDPADSGAVVRAWLLADDAERALDDLADLIGWLDRVYLAYPGASVPTCWLWHPAMVEELWWLRQTHAEAYHPQVGSWVRVGDWHDRLRPNVVARLRKAAIACELSLHKPGAEQGHPGPRTPLTSAAAALAAWAAAGRPDPAPEPTEAELEQAEQFHRDSVNRSRR
jgi:hypothetical protein